MATQAKCKKCGNNFMIIDQEIAFYKEKDLPLPENCPKCRQDRRLALRNKREMFGYKCDKCGKDIVIAFDPPDDQEVYCKQCYEKFMQANDNILGYSEGAKAQQSQKGQ